MYQASFNFPFLDHYLDDEFLTSEENLEAFNFISKYDVNNKDYPKIFAIIGEKFCGKTHLSHIWERKISAVFLEVEDLAEFEMANIIEKDKSYILENVQSIKNQNNLFHLFNIIVENNANLMITSNICLSQIKYKIKDLESRFKNVFEIKIGNPQPEFIEILLVKQFSLKQLLVSDNVIKFIAKNIDRSYESINKLVKLLEFYSLEQKKKISLTLAKEILNSPSFI